MRILSIDLPWGGPAPRKYYGFAGAEVGGAQGPLAHVWVESVAAVAELGPTLSALVERMGLFDLILVDQPLGGHEGANGLYRNVERAFGNSSVWEPGFQAPRFQPGAPHALTGLAQATVAIEVAGAHGASAVESFPQLGIVPLLMFAESGGGRLPRDQIARLAAHKVGNAAQRAQAVLQWTTILNAFFGTAELGLGSGPGDSIDALLGLAAGVVAAGFRHAVNGPEALWNQPIWLLTDPPGAVDRAHALTRGHPGRMAARAGWMAVADGVAWPPGVRHHGVLALRHPHWPQPRHAVVPG